jgi:hypothetical protein
MTAIGLGVFLFACSVFLLLGAGALLKDHPACKPEREASKESQGK